jgi:hypothetical protein
MSDGPNHYFVKIRGRTLGPFTADRLRQMAQQGQLSRINLISNDGQDWVKAGEFPDFFEGVGSPARTAVAAVATEPAVVAPVNGASNQAKAEWHYAIGAQQHGPVTFGQIRGLVANGTLASGELVWKEGMADWEPVSSVPELAASLPQRQENARKRERRSRRERDEELRDAGADLTETKRVIRAGIGWAFFLTITAYVFAGLIFFVSIAGIVVGARSQQGIVIAQGIVNLLFSGIVVTAAVFFNRYASHSARFCTTTDVNDLNHGLQWLSRLWLFLGIFVIFALAMTLISIVYAIAIGADLSRFTPY